MGPSDFKLNTTYEIHNDGAYKGGKVCYIGKYGITLETKENSKFPIAYRSIYKVVLIKPALNLYF